mmetsp:Transcript_44048/g.101644  ORF Transcript_44048/g.101644 Transcript_44048/m.101644 type:complete len:282 (-) Transcript_44048:157-1002(-)
MHRTKEFNNQRIVGMGFVLVVFIIIMCIHCVYVFLIFGPHLWAWWATLILIIYHFFFLNLMLAFYQCITTDPGVVPPNWGFYMGDETKRRRYCKMCNVWKPDRVHHCSICNRCNLNMDHHCPWINNCVGYYNRKFFMQLLFYAYTSISIIEISSFYDVVANILTVVHNTPLWRSWFLIKALLGLLMFCLCTMLLITLTNFIKFHVKLVLENYTTIENLEREEGAKSKFDIGWRRNWEQVFGANPYLWWLPLHTQSSRPVGDGVRWRIDYTRVIDEDEEPAE